MSYKVNATDLTNIRFNEADTLSSVLQNIAVILRRAAFRSTGSSACPQSSWINPCPLQK